MSLQGNLANQEIINFLRTVTIKNSYFADKLNTALMRPNTNNYILEKERPYVRKLAGQYTLKEEYECTVISPAGKKIDQVYADCVIGYRTSTDESILTPTSSVFYDTAFDTMMTVTSLDTGKEIPFTLENLHDEFALDAGYNITDVHHKTLEAYKVPGRYFDLLCERYPSQVDLIKAIVYPVSPREITAEEKQAYRQFGVPYPSIQLRQRERIANAANFEILNYDDSIFQENERVVMTTQLRNVIDHINLRWNIRDFEYEENFGTVVWALMWSILPLALTAQRYANIKTPFVHMIDIWDHLNSKGLATYKGYLTIKQTLFLYKNINYLLNHRGKQKTMNILIDNILQDVGLNVHAKTVVLDTSDTLTDGADPITCESQCVYCNKKDTCVRKISTYDCPFREIHPTLCKAEPAVITEEFAGSCQEKVIKALMDEYGYTQEKAAQKLQRAYIWKDPIVENIIDDLDRDQLTDQNLGTETLKGFIQKEYKAGLEPEFNDGIVAEQRNLLRHASGTVVPTKQLEIVPSDYNVKYQDLFNRFMTESCLFLMDKVQGECSFTILDGATIFLVNFKELLGLIYLGFLHEELADIVEYRRDPTAAVSAHFTEAFNPVYHSNFALNTTEHKWDYKFAVPTKAKITTAFKLYRPVKQEELVLTWNSSYGKNMSVTGVDGVPELDGDTRACKIRNEIYIVRKDDTLTDEMWDHQPVKLKILGKIATATQTNTIGTTTYLENNDQIAIIPQYVRWYSGHCYPTEHSSEEDIVAAENGATVKVYDPDDCDENGVFKEILTKWYIDRTSGKFYQLIITDQYLDIDKLIDDYVDVSGVFRNLQEFGDYMTKMFKMLENVYVFASASNSIRTHLVCESFLKHVLVNKSINFKFTDTTATEYLTYDPDKSDYPSGNYVTYNTWFNADAALQSSINAIDVNADPQETWDEFISTAYNLIVKHIDLHYARDVTNVTQYKKLKQLVVRLSSYKVNFVDGDDNDKVSESTAIIASDATVDSVDTESTEYLYPIVDSPCQPHLGSITENEGDVYVITSDVIFDNTKTYYRAKMGTNGCEYENLILKKIPEGTVINLGNAYFKYDAANDEYSEQTEFVELDEGELVANDNTYVPMINGDAMPVDTYYEKYNVYDLLGLQRGTLISITVKDGVWYYQLGTRTVVDVSRPACTLDDEYSVEADTYLDEDERTAEADKDVIFGYLKPEVKEKLDCQIMRKLVPANEYTWGELIRADALKVLQPSISKFLFTTKEVTNLETESEVIAFYFKKDDDLITRDDTMPNNILLPPPPENPFANTNSQE